MAEFYYMTTKNETGCPLTFHTYYKVGKLWDKFDEVLI